MNKWLIGLFLVGIIILSGCGKSEPDIPVSVSNKGIMVCQDFCINSNMSYSDALIETDLIKCSCNKIFLR